METNLCCEGKEERKGRKKQKDKERAKGNEKGTQGFKDRLTSFHGLLSTDSLQTDWSWGKRGPSSTMIQRKLHLATPWSSHASLPLNNKPLHPPTVRIQFLGITLASPCLWDSSAAAFSREGEAVPTDCLTDAAQEYLEASLAIGQVGWELPFWVSGELHVEDNSLERPKELSPCVPDYGLLTKSLLPWLGTVSNGNWRSLGPGDAEEIIIRSG